MADQAGMAAAKVRGRRRRAGDAVSHVWVAERPAVGGMQAPTLIVCDGRPCDAREKPQCIGGRCRRETET